MSKSLFPTIILVDPVAGLCRYVIEICSTDTMHSHAGLFKNVFGGHTNMSYLGATDADVLDFW